MSDFDKIKRAPAFDDTDHETRAEAWVCSHGEHEGTSANEDMESLAREFEQVFRAGWGWAFGIIGMAEAIRNRPQPSCDMNQCVCVEPGPDYSCAYWMGAVPRL